MSRKEVTPISAALIRTKGGVTDRTRANNRTYGDAVASFLPASYCTAKPGSDTTILFAYCLAMLTVESVLPPSTTIVSLSLYPCLHRDCNVLSMVSAAFREMTITDTFPIVSSINVGLGYPRPSYMENKAFPPGTTRLSWSNPPRLHIPNRRPGPQSLV